MKDTLFSPSWYRVAGLRPRIRSHFEIHRHLYRGELWYILQDHSSERYQRFTPAAHLVIGLMDGSRTIQEIWDAGRLRLKEDAPTQEEVLHLLSQLHSVDALQVDTQPDMQELLKRFKKQRHGRWKQNLRSPLFMRFQLLDPETFLTRFQWMVRPFFSWAGAILWIAVVTTAIYLVGFHWPELTKNISDRILAPTNLLILWLVFPFLKAFHEFGHAFAVKIYGGEVHEMGIMFLVFTPIPYVDASAASAFHRKRERIVVGAAGLLVEIFLAAVAFFVWINAVPGTLRAIAFNVMVIAGISSVLFNGNPLLRYDAYYILTDILEIPNLGTRGTRFMGYLAKRYLFGMTDEEPPLSSSDERVWFVIYSTSAFIYRIFIYTAIILFIASKFFIIGMVFAAWTLVNMVVIPVGKGIKFLFYSPGLRNKRNRAFTVCGMIIVMIVSFVFLVPVPLSTIAEGVIWIPEASFVRAGTDGFVDQLLARSDSRIRRNDPLIQCTDPFLPAQIRVLEAHLRELKARYDNQVLTDRIQAEIIDEEIQHVVAQIADAVERVDELTIRSTTDGRFIVPMAEDLPGRFVKRGELLGYVLDRFAVSARVVVTQPDVDFVRQKTYGVRVRFPEKLAVSLPARLLREVPAATDQLPSRILSQEGGGEIAIDPRDMMGIKAFVKIFLFDIELPTHSGLVNVGGRVYVRFDHGQEPLFWRWYREARKLFLRRFNV
jgi:putative peptide zinc metalloprotease protein